MDMPKPGDAHRRLSRLVGRWTGGEKLYPGPWDPTGGPATATITNRVILDGFAVVQEYAQSRRGQVNFRGHGVFWYDQERQQYVMTWWDSLAGRPGEFRGSFNGEVLQLSSPMQQGGHSRAAFDLSKRGQYKFVMEISQDGQSWTPAMEGTYKPRAAATKKPAARKAQKRGGRK